MEATGPAGTIIILFTIHAIETRRSKVQYEYRMTSLLLLLVVDTAENSGLCILQVFFGYKWIRLILVWQSREMQRRSQNVVKKEGAARRFEQAGNEGMCRGRVRLLSFPLNDRLYVTKMPSTKISLSGSFHSHL